MPVSESFEGVLSDLFCGTAKDYRSIASRLDQLDDHREKRIAYIALLARQGVCTEAEKLLEATAFSEWPAPYHLLALAVAGYLDHQRWNNWYYGGCYAHYQIQALWSPARKAAANKAVWERCFNATSGKWQAIAWYIGTALPQNRSLRYDILCHYDTSNPAFAREQLSQRVGSLKQGFDYLRQGGWPGLALQLQLEVIQHYLDLGQADVAEAEWQLFQKEVVASDFSLELQETANLVATRMSARLHTSCLPQAGLLASLGGVMESEFFGESKKHNDEMGLVQGAWCRQQIGRLASEVVGDIDVAAAHQVLQYTGIIFQQELFRSAELNTNNSLDAERRLGYEELLSKAMVCFKELEDTYSYRLAEVLRICFRLRFSGDWMVDTKIAATGIWCQESGNFSMGLLFGHLLSQLGWRLLRTDFNPDRAGMALQLALRLYQDIGAEWMVAQVQADLAKVHRIQGNLLEQVKARQGAIASYTALFAVTNPVNKFLANNLAGRISALSIGQLQLAMQFGRVEDGTAVLEQVEASWEVLEQGGVREGETPWFWDNFLRMLMHNRQFLLVKKAMHAVREQLHSGDGHRQKAAEARQVIDALPPGYRHSWHFRLAMLLQETDIAREHLRAQAELVKKNFAAPPPKIAGPADLIKQLFLPLVSKTPPTADTSLVQKSLPERIIAYFQLMVNWNMVGEYEEAWHYLQVLEGLSGHWAATMPEQEVLCLTTAAWVSYQYGDRHQADAYNSRALAAVNNGRLQTRDDHDRLTQMHFNQAASPYLLATLMEWDEGAFNAAFRQAEGAQARALLDMLYEQKELIEKRPVAAQVKWLRWREWQGQLRILSARQHQLTQKNLADPTLAEQIALLKRQVATLEASLFGHQPTASAAVTDDALPDARESADFLLPEEILLKYTLIEKKLLVWVVGDKGLLQARAVAVETDTFLRHLTGFLKACYQAGDYESHAKYFTQLLLEPISEYLNAAQTIYWVANLQLAQFPIAALPWEGGVLADRFALIQLPSASMLKLLHRPTGLASEDWLIAGNATEDLPGASQEANYVAQLAGCEAIVGAQATESHLRTLLPNAGYIHLATHAHIEPVHPLASALLLADGEELSLFELMGLRLKAQLVTLSACATAAGVMTSNSEVMSLSRGLLVAGAQSVVVSHWPVDDRATCLLMGAFCRQLHQGVHPAKALSLAQSWLRRLSPEKAKTLLDEMGKTAFEPQTANRLRSGRDELYGPALPDYRHPFYWAAFVYTGR